MTPEHPRAGHEPLPADLLLACARRVRRGMIQALEPVGLTPHHARALGTLDREGPMRLGTLATALHVVPRSVTDVVDRLVADGWATRIPDPHDRRAQVIETTPAGHELAQRVAEARRVAGEELLAPLGPEERAELVRLLGMLLEEDRQP
ncbi:DNA-binding transcriptional regulator, MarR family [Kytococcus aerolatus]|uniref:DNA-binding transcriptional regulator, MarR family n=1 Tax=Kytococcus aerolatus TaxID=592308 RepID=A0A212TE69_9MICO|nr:MarR family transcriptional regulator [Kytococcus aerolatus]SNC64116.1 DNA-binding transcriptional regulator, MarR family [Kytococcus aerolatus]